jgi:uncharacterized membrane protein
MQPIVKARFEQFSDGVFAIAITLLALELHAPEINSTTLAQAAQEGIALLPTMFSFIISFITIAIFWVNHHQLTHAITVINRRRILWANMFFLLFLTLIPFVTQIVGRHPLNPISLLSYSLVLFGGSVSFSLVRLFIHKSIDEKSIPLRRSFFGPVVYLLAATVSLASPWACYALLIIPALYYFLPKAHPHQSS